MSPCSLIVSSVILTPCSFSSLPMLLIECRRDVLFAHPNRAKGCSQLSMLLLDHHPPMRFFCGTFLSYIMTVHDLRYRIRRPTSNNPFSPCRYLQSIGLSGFSSMYGVMAQTQQTFLSLLAYLEHRFIDIVAPSFA